MCPIRIEVLRPKCPDSPRDMDAQLPTAGNAASLPRKAACVELILQSYDDDAVAARTLEQAQERNVSDGAVPRPFAVSEHYGTLRNASVTYLVHNTL